jgi:hypothetical protein
MARFNVENGFEADCDVIYGDTDSVMVDFRVIAVLDPSGFKPVGSPMVTRVITQEDGH